jgi:hypothetical protein
VVLFERYNKPVYRRRFCYIVFILRLVATAGIEHGTFRVLRSYANYEIIGRSCKVHISLYGSQNTSSFNVSIFYCVRLGENSLMA